MALAVGEPARPSRSSSAVGMEALQGSPWAVLPGARCTPHLRSPRTPGGRHRRPARGRTVGPRWSLGHQTRRPDCCQEDPCGPSLGHPQVTCPPPVSSRPQGSESASVRLGLRCPRAPLLLPPQGAAGRLVPVCVVGRVRPCPQHLRVRLPRGLCHHCPWLAAPPEVTPRSQETRGRCGAGL